MTEAWWASYSSGEDARCAGQTWTIVERADLAILTVKRHQGGPLGTVHY